MAIRYELGGFEFSDIMRPIAIAGSTVIGTAVGGPVGGAVAGGLVAKASSSSGAKMASSPLTDCLSKNMLGGKAAQEACVKAYGPGSAGASKAAPFDIMAAFRTFESNAAKAIAQTAPKAPARPSTTPKLGVTNVVGIYDNQAHPFYVSARKTLKGASLLISKRFVVKPENIIPLFAQWPVLSSEYAVIEALGLKDNANRAKYNLPPLGPDRASAGSREGGSSSILVLGGLAAAAGAALYLWNKSQKKRGQKGLFG
jgi:hypothetical protein